ncbi:hypothetical protein KUC3_16730 [Alteromonas sp. KC3]|uniref:hypothetical protein n=1 Tax=unclassified Alteromonas TaxID=2614992 RepID=UPI001938BF5D|nr:hypothetical protein KUC3_16730 [Alteromonas sp. KC3]BCO22779.1 hypothetical protein KUC14_16480 [Alteromonas sp. KC14]
MEAEPEDLAKFQQLPPRRQTLAAMTLAMDREIGKVLDIVWVQWFEKASELAILNRFPRAIVAGIF